MANPHVVVLNYGPKGLLADPDPVQVKSGENITFRLGVGPQNGKIRVIFKEPSFFSRGTFEHDAGPVQVSGPGPFPRLIHYDCHLFVDGKEMPQPPVPPGGGVELGSGN